MSSISAIQACIGSSATGKPCQAINEILDKISASIVALRAQNAELEQIRTLSLIHLAQFRNDYNALENSYQALRAQYQLGQVPSANRLISRNMRFTAHGERVKLLFTLRLDSLVGAIKFSRDGSSFCFCDGKHFFIVSDTGDLQFEAALAVETEYTRSLAFSSDGSKVAIACAGGVVQIVDLATSEVRSLSGHTDEVTAVAFSNDDQLLYTGGRDGILLTWDVVSGKHVLEEKFSGQGEAKHAIVAIQVLGESLMVGFMEGDVRICEGGKLKRTFTVAHDGFVIGMKVSDDEKTLVTVGEDKTVKLWSLGDDVACIKTLSGHKDFVVSACFRSDNALLLTGSRDRTLRAWHLDGDTSDKFVISGFPNTIVDISHHPTQPRFVTACGDRSISLWQYDL